MTEIIHFYDIYQVEHKRIKGKTLKLFTKISYLCSDIRRRGALERAEIIPIDLMQVMLP